MDDSCCMCMGHIHDLHQMGHDQNFSFDVYFVLRYFWTDCSPAFESS